MAVHLKGFIAVVSVLTLLCVSYLILGSDFKIHRTSLGVTMSRAPFAKDAVLNAVKLQPQPPSRGNTDTSPMKEGQQLSQSLSARGPCADSLCLEYLSKSERREFDKCTSKGVSLSKKRFKSATLSNGICHFVNGAGRRRVALASFPGSGNTWVRGLLEMTSGICTGSIYCDFTLRSNGFAGEYIQGSSVIAFKTHTHPAGAEAAVYIIRSPWDALVAEWNRQCNEKSRKRNITETEHSLSVGVEYFGHNQSWEKFLHQSADCWQTSVIEWSKFGKQHPLLVVYFEDLKANVTGEVERMLDFLQVSYSREQVEERLEQNFTLFKRRHHREFEHYTTEQRAYITQVIAKTKQELENNNSTGIIQIERYLVHET